MVDRLIPKNPILKAEQGQTASTDVIYNSDHQDFAIWSRLAGPGGTWERETPEIDISGKELTGGAIKTRHLGPGQVLEYAMVASKTADPNGKDFPEGRFVAKAMIMCVLKKAIGEDWYEDHTAAAEGTFASVNFHGKSDTAFALTVQLGKAPAVLDDDGLPVVPQPVMSVGSPAFLQHHTGLMFMPLDPGETYFWSAVMMDPQGRYWGKRFLDPITTKMRRIVISILNMEIIDDGDNDFIVADTNDFDVTIMLSKNGKAQVEATFSVKNADDKKVDTIWYNIDALLVMGPSPGLFNDTIEVSAFVQDDDGDTGKGSYILPNNNSNEPQRLPFGPSEKVSELGRGLNVGDDIGLIFNLGIQVDYI
jgi:hypothetical protein